MSSNTTEYQPRNNAKPTQKNLTKIERYANAMAQYEWNVCQISYLPSTSRFGRKRNRLPILPSE